METKELTLGNFSINYGLILGIIIMLISIITYSNGMALDGVQWPNTIYYVIFPVVIIYAISNYKKKNNGILSLATAIKIGLLIGVISALVYAIYGLIFNYIIDPEFMGQVIERTGEKLMENPNLSPEIVEKQLEMMKKFQNPFLGSAVWVAFSAIFGLIYSLIGGLVMKKEE
ncbi:DUF4199 domain-containing protein [Thalassobellus sediminis]|uniref:DUF4199 domain-containing protein n=1 Tax=Thalassobellus sediminis TaxID=3367753 RepID=UPI0037978FFF